MVWMAVYQFFASSSQILGIPIAVNFEPWPRRSESDILASKRTQLVLLRRYIVFP
jgi:hypothetical protein